MRIDCSQQFNCKMLVASIALAFLLLAHSAFAGYVVVPLKSRHVAILDLSNDGAVCEREIGQIPTLLTPLFGVRKPGGENKMVYCGGEVENGQLAHEHSNNCHLLNLDASEEQWEPFGHLLYGRRRGVAVNLDDGRIFVAGGSSNLGWDDHTLDTTEILTLEGDRLKNTIEGNRLPRKYSKLCVARLNEKEAVFTGSRPDGKQYATILNLDTLQFSKEIFLPIGRYNAMCGVIKNELVLFGGRDSKTKEAVDTVTFVDVKTNAYRQGPAMPVKTSFASFSDTNGDELVVNVGSGTFSFDGEHWRQLEGAKGIRWDNAAHTAIYLEDVDC